MKTITEMAKELGGKLPMQGTVARIAKGFAKDLASKLFLRTISAASRIKNADREKLMIAMKAGSVVLVGFLIASKLFGLQLILAVMGGSVALSELLDRVEDETDKEKIREAFEAVKGEPKVNESVARERVMSHLQTVLAQNPNAESISIADLAKALEEGKPINI